MKYLPLIVVLSIIIISIGSFIFSFRAYEKREAYYHSLSPCEQAEYTLEKSTFTDQIQAASLEMIALHCKS